MWGEEIRGQKGWQQMKDEVSGDYRSGLEGWEGGRGEQSERKGGKGQWPLLCLFCVLLNCPPVPRSSVTSRLLIPYSSPPPTLPRSLSLKSVNC